MRLPVCFPAIAMAFSAACGGGHEPSVPPGGVVAPPLTSATAGGDEARTARPFDPVALGATEAGVTALCDDHLRAAQSQLDRLKTLKGASADQLTYEATLGRFDEVVLEVQNASAFPALMGVAHPDKAVRDAAKACEPKTDKFSTALYLDADAASVLKAYAAAGGAKLDGERAKLLRDVLRDFRRNGLELPPEKQPRLRELNAEISEIGQRFEANIAGSTGKIELRPSQLAGLPEAFVAKHAPGPNGKVVVTTDYPDYFPFATYAKDRKAALALYVEFVNRGGDENVKLLERLLDWRHAKAKLLGYPTWAAYAIEPRMAKTPEAVREFLTRVSDAVREPAKAEYAELAREHVALGGKKTDRIPPNDRTYLEDKVRAKKYRLDSQEVSKYFEVRAVAKGLLDITSRMYGLEYRPVHAPVWHPDVTAYDVWDTRTHARLGRFYLDLYSRPDKYKHAAVFLVRPSKRVDGVAVQLPEAALEYNLPRPALRADGSLDESAPPALLQHEDVVTFFHEFGHVLHQILTRSELASFAGTQTAVDFVESPSQMFEEWPWSREILDLFARHYQTGAKIPDDLFEAMTRSRTFGRALATQRQLLLGALDMEYHSREPGFDTTKVYADVARATDSFPYVEGTHMQSSFGHLVGYDAGYYGYQWALALSRDVLTRFRKEGLLNTETATSWRNEVLSKGGGVDPRVLIARFLGHEPSEAAYIAFLKGQD